jgi:hypothetical protein
LRRNLINLSLHETIDAANEEEIATDDVPVLPGIEANVHPVAMAK